MLLSFKPLRIDNSETELPFYVERAWVFKHFFDNEETFKALVENKNKDKFRFGLKTFGEMNKALKILDRAGFDYELVEDLRPFVLKLDRFAKYAQYAEELCGIYRSS